MKNINKFFDELIEQSNSISVARLAKVVKFNADKMSVDVMPLPSEDNSIILNVPVATVKSNDYLIYYPLKAGDNVVLIFVDNDTDNILMGEDSIQSERKHDISDCVCIGGITLLKDSVDVEEKDSLVIKSDSAKIVVDKSSVKVEAQKIELKGYAEYKGSEIAVKGDSTTDGATIV